MVANEVVSKREKGHSRINPEEFVLAELIEYGEGHIDWRSWAYPICGGQ